MTATRSNRIAHALLVMVGFFVGIVLAIIVSRTLVNDTSVLTKQQRKLEVERAPVEYVRVPGIGRVAYQFLFEEISEPGESLDSFASRIGPRLREYSDSSDFEACGVLATDGQRFGVRVGTSRAHAACLNFASKVPTGMRSVDQTIHSHGTDRHFNANKNDIALLGGQALGSGALRSVAGQRLDAFSKTDFDGGAGYLATPSGVLHQAGSNSVREVPAPSVKAD